jgi:hypothetical protein
MLALPAVTHPRRERITVARFGNRWLTVPAALAAVVLGVTAPARAELRLRVDDLASGTGFVLTDVDGDGKVAVASGTRLGTFTLMTLSALSRPTVPAPAGVLAALDLNSFVTAGGAGTLRLTVEDSGFIGGDPGSHLTAIAGLGGVLPRGATVTAQSWVDPTNAVPDLGPDRAPGTPLGPMGGVPATSLAVYDPAFSHTAPPAGFSAEGRAGFTAAGPYSVFTQITVQFQGAGMTGSDADIAVRSLPAPAGLALVASGLPLLALGCGLRRRKAPAT